MMIPARRIVILCSLTSLLGALPVAAQSTEYTLPSLVQKAVQWGEEATAFSEYRWQQSRDELLNSIIGSTIRVSGPIDATRIRVENGTAQVRVILARVQKTPNSADATERAAALAAAWLESVPKWERPLMSTTGYSRVWLQGISFTLRDTSDRMAMELTGTSRITSVGRIKEFSISNGGTINIIIELTTWRPE